MFKLLENCRVFAPEDLGMMDILIAGERIALMAPQLDKWKALPEVTREDLGGSLVCPGLVDSHVHITGGGGEMGPSSRMPAPRLEDFTLNGVSTVLGLLGTDGVSRSLENLLFTCEALSEQGLCVRLLTGHYGYPTTTLMGSVQRDISLIPSFIGVKVALCDHRGANVDASELSRLAADARVGGMLSNKPGITVMHIGSCNKRLDTLFEALDGSQVPPAHFIPTHCGRSEELTLAATAFNQRGGTIDFTAKSLSSPEGASRLVVLALENGADPDRITISSDAGGSKPVFDNQGHCVRIDMGTSDTLLGELRRLIHKFGLTPSQALSFFTTNPARVMGLGHRKGRLSPGADADILVLRNNFTVRHLLLRGKAAVWEGSAVNPA